MKSWKNTAERGRQGSQARESDEGDDEEEKDFIDVILKIQSALGQTWILKLGLINKWTELELRSRKLEVLPGPPRPAPP